ncbi:MAG: hypothetical protein Kow0010_03510 [Dehalococcoidia bacterium]
MSDFARMLLVFFATVNPAYVLLSAAGPLSGRGGRAPLAGAAGVIAVVLALAAAFGSNRILDALEVEPETFRTSAGIVMVVVGVLIIWRPTERYPFDPGPGAAIFPLAIPLLAGPATLVAAISSADDPGRAETALAATIIVAATASAVAIAPARFEAALTSIARLTGALLIVLAVALIVSGVRDI